MGKMKILAGAVTTKNAAQGVGILRPGEFHRAAEFGMIIGKQDNMVVSRKNTSIVTQIRVPPPKYSKLQKFYDSQKLD